MKKRFTLMLLAALVAVMSYAQPVKRSQAVLGSPVAALAHKPILRKAVTNVQLPAQMPQQRMKKAPKKAVSLDALTWPLHGIAINEQYDLDNNNQLVEAVVPLSGIATYVNKVDDTHISILGLTSDANLEITAEVNLEDGTFSIPDGTNIATTDDGTVAIFNPMEEGAPITGTISEEGISFNDLWYDALIDGDYAGYMYSGYLYYTEAIVPANGTMTFENTNFASPADVYIEQANYVTTVFNFGGTGAVIDIDMKEDNIFSISSQITFEGSTTTGNYYFYGLNDEVTSLVNPYVGTGTATELPMKSLWTFYSENSYWYGLFSETSITLTDGSTFEFPVIEDVAVMPAQPTMADIYPYDEEDEYGAVKADVPCTDAEGNLLKEGKLFYILYADVEGEVTPITYTPELYKNLTEELTEIPYTLNDNWDFQVKDGYKEVFLNYDFTNYTRIGVQSVYYGGGERNATEIDWMDVPVVEPVVTESIVWVAEEQGYTDAQDVTDIDFGEGITATLEQGSGSVPPRYYDNGKALRLYAGNEMTITSEEAPIVKIIFTMATATTDISASDGELKVNEQVVTWTGSANEITFYGPSSKHARIAQIEIFYAVEEKEPELIELPEGAEVSEYKFVGTTEVYVYDEETGEPTGETEMTRVERSAMVAFVDDQVYIQGLSDCCSDAWVVGTLVDNVLTIPADEYLGDYYEMDEAWNPYIYSIFTNEAVFTYDSEKDEFTAATFTTYPVYEGTPYQAYTMDAYTDVVLTKINDVPAVPADPEITGVDFDMERYPYVAYNIPTVDVDGNDLLSSKLFYRLFVETEEGVSQYVCQPGIYMYLDEEMAEIPYTFSDGFDIYSDHLYVYTDAEDFTGWKQVGIQSVYYGGGEMHESNLVWLDLTDYWEAVGINDVAAKSVKNVKYFDLQGRPATDATRGIVIAVKQMQDGTTKTEKIMRK